jgi:transposase
LPPRLPSSPLDKGFLDDEMAAIAVAALDKIQIAEHRAQIFQHGRASAQHGAVGFDIQRQLPDVGEQLSRCNEIKELVEKLPDLAALVEPLLIVRRVLRQQIGVLHRRLLAVVRDDAVCRRLIVPGVGPVVALTFRATVDVPARFKNSKAVGAVFGLTPSRHQSSESDRPGGISRCGDEMMRMMLYEAAQILLVRSPKWSWLKAWAMKIARHRGMKKAIVALARRLAVIMHRIWVDGTEFRWAQEETAAA